MKTVLGNISYYVAFLVRRVQLVIGIPINGSDNVVLFVKDTQMH